MPQNLSGYIKQLQELEAQGHGDLPVCLFDGDNSPGWFAIRENCAPRLERADYQDESSTAHPWKHGLFVAL